MNGKRILIATGVVLFVCVLRFLLPREGTLLTGGLAACIAAEGGFPPW